MSGSDKSRKGISVTEAALGVEFLCVFPLWNSVPSAAKVLQNADAVYRNASATFPSAINFAVRAKSSYITRSLSMLAHTERIA